MLVAPLSPFVRPDQAKLASGKFENPLVTAKGEARAAVRFETLDTLWFNTGTLCNLACQTCYIESSPTNDALVYLTLAEVAAYLDEIADHALPTRDIGFTGGEPFMNRDCPAMIELALVRGFTVLVLTNAMRPMRRFEAALCALPHRDRLTMRVSLDHYTKEVHEAERGPQSWDKAIDGLKWLAANGFSVAVAGRHLPDESDADARRGYAALFAQHNLQIADTGLVLFPEINAQFDVPEITTACWDILDVAPQAMMCSSSRMVVKRRGEAMTRVAACTLLPFDAQFDLGASLVEAHVPVRLNHSHCARFCVLGGASCSA